VTERPGGAPFMPVPGPPPGRAEFARAGGATPAGPQPPAARAGAAPAPSRRRPLHGALRTRAPHPGGCCYGLCRRGVKPLRAPRAGKGACGDRAPPTAARAGPGRKSVSAPRAPSHPPARYIRPRRCHEHPPPRATRSAAPTPRKAPKPRPPPPRALPRRCRRPPTCASTSCRCLGSPPRPRQVRRAPRRRGGATGHGARGPPLPPPTPPPPRPTPSTPRARPSLQTPAP
jgi:hypothetical protein